MFDDTAQSWSNLVPEVFYDIISRIPAGAILIMTILSLSLNMPLTDPDKGALKIFSALLWAPATIFLILLLVASYAVGLMLTAFGHIHYIIFWRKKLWREASGYYKIEAIAPWKEKLEKLASNQCDGDCIDIIDRDIHFWLKSRNPDAKRILPKMRAEAGLAHNGLAACTLAIVFSLVVWKIQGGPIISHGTHLAILALLWILFVVAAPFRSRSYIRTQLTFLVQALKKPS